MHLNVVVFLIIDIQVNEEGVEDIRVNEEGVFNHRQFGNVGQLVVPKYMNRFWEVTFTCWIAGQFVGNVIRGQFLIEV